ncbi:tRNA (guanine(26)-N(2))-dimethyltransferase [Halorussus salilacus]|uniref:tRNA (guanine(26)-N(2))-dimethyltransferase n=1 Tax=Halorussus salilacus TaxID=2953750 RepID=UPI00209FC155|nr:tRNA (guanine(26)-N(2))-dimethyltransferase [Halorussus salilacus]USZ67097.1 tRNA (guanine(26)-N(2))-dimethyltransferase [Halorussus salilacus]
MHVSEGRVEVEVPEQGGEGIGDEVFFNPVQELNRDLTVATLRAYGDREPRAESYLDAMAASGIRGVRAAAEGWDVTLADIDAEAVELCRRNLERNGLDAEVAHRDANALMHESVFDVVDIDPFGTPIPFVDAAFANTRDLVCVTATDTAPLCGAHFHSGVRKYGAIPRNTDYHTEMGVRILLSAMARTAARYDAGVTPILTHATNHYVRTYLELDHSASDANAAIEELGHVYHCEDCLYREHDEGLVADPLDSCPECASERVLTAGPLWLGPAHDADFVAEVREEVDDEMGTATRARRLLDALEAELHEPTHYDQHRLCKEWTRSASGMDEFLDRLRDAGFEASRAHYGGTTFKTPATVSEIREATRAE